MIVPALALSLALVGTPAAAAEDDQPPTAASVATPPQAADQELPPAVQAMWRRYGGGVETVRRPAS